MATIDELRAAGFSDDEIAANKAPELREAGFTDQEIEQHITGLRNPRQIPPALLERFQSGNKSLQQSRSFRIGQAFVEGAQAGFGSEPLAGEAIKGMQELKLFRTPGQPYDRPLQLFNEVLVGNAMKAVDATFRGINAAIMGTGAAVGQAVSEVGGGDENDAAKARREFSQGLAIAALLAGAHTPMSRGDGIVGHLPNSQDFTNAARAISERPRIDVPVGGRLPPEPDLAAMRATLTDLYENHGLHPSEVAHDVMTDPQKAAAFDAYHGSPHDFESFDVSKIGTGEGAQAFGHGIYFAENQDVAAGYRARLSTGDFAEANDMAATYLKLFSSREVAIESLRANADEYELGHAVKPDVLRAAADLLEAGGEIKEPGVLYRTRINADPAHFLDWHKPLSEQSEYVQNALKSIGIKEVRQERALGQDVRYLEMANTGEDIYRQLRGDIVRNPEKASETLLAAGIPGIKYLDQGSREGGAGTRNFIVFSDKIVEITHKNGVPVGPPPDLTQITPIRGSKVDKDVIKSIMENTGASREEAQRVVDATPRSEHALTGVPNIDAVIEKTKHLIDDPVINRTNDVPYGAGAGKFLDDATVNIDRHIPRSITVDGVTFDPAEPFTIHEMVERSVMEDLIAGGMDKQTAYKVAHFEYAEKAEGAWYKAHGIDQAKAEAAYKPMLDQIQHENPASPPADLYDKPYPHDDEAMAKGEKTEAAAGEDKLYRMNKASLENLEKVKAGPHYDPALDQYKFIEPNIKALKEWFAAHQAPEETSGLPPAAEIARAEAIMQRTQNAADANGVPANQNLATIASVSPIMGGGSGGGMPPRQGFMAPGAPPPQPNPRGPYFRYDDRGIFQKAYEGTLNTWAKTFQPELISDKALQAEPFFAEAKSRIANKKDQTIINSEEGYQFWRQRGDAERLEFLERFEAGQRQVTPEMQALADGYRVTMDKAYEWEKSLGSKADYFENYIYHLYQDPIKMKEWMANRAAQRGAAWFQKERVFDTMKEAMAEGLRLKTTNPEEIMTHRFLASADMIERSNLLNNLRAMDLAVPAEEIGSAMIGHNQPPPEFGMSRTGLLHEGWQEIKAPNGDMWLLAPDIQPLWENAMAAPGLWGKEGLGGDLFRGTMAIKAAWIPIKLGLSGFHPLHISGIQAAQGFARGLRQLQRGDLQGALGSMVEGFTGQFQAMAPKTLQHPGYLLREQWKLPEDQRTPWGQAMVDLFHEGGMVPQQAEELRISGKRNFEKAWDDASLMRIIPTGLALAVKKLQAPIFEHWIPNLKAAAYMADAQDLLTRRPELMLDPVQRRAALRVTGQQIEARFGEMFYGTMFWNRTTQDLGKAYFISLGWNKGYVGDFLGNAILNPALFRPIRDVTRVIDQPAGTPLMQRIAQAGPTETEMTRLEARNAKTYWGTYTIGMGILGGLTTWALTGETPQDLLDYVYSRTGRKNPDGTDHRLNTPAFNREPFMLMKHVQEHGGNGLAGVAELLGSKGVFSPALEWWRNKNYFGVEISNENDPIYMRGLQQAEWLFKEQLSPITVSGHQQVIRSGGGWGEVLGSYLGYGPAPGYVDKTALENRIAYLYRRFAAPEARSRDEGENSKVRGDIRNEVLLAKQKGDAEAVKKGIEKWYAAKGSKTGADNMMLGIPGRISMFRALPEEQQEAILKDASREQQREFEPYRKVQVARKFMDMTAAMMKANEQGQEATAAMIDRQRTDFVRDMVDRGHITDMTTFRRSVANEAKSRGAPFLSAILRQPKAIRGQFLDQAIPGLQ